MSSLRYATFYSLHQKREISLDRCMLFTSITRIHLNCIYLPKKISGAMKDFSVDVYGKHILVWYGAEITVWQ